MFSRNQILLATVLGGPLPAGYLVSHNFRNMRLSRHSALAKWGGYVLAFLGFVLLTLFWERGGVNVGITQDHWLGRLETSFLVLILLHVFLAGVIWMADLWMQNRSEAHVLPVTPQIKYSFVHLIPYLFLGIGLSVYYSVSGPFRFTFLVIYLLPHIYLYRHMKRVFTGKRSGRVFTSVFLAVLLLFPVSMLMNENSGSPFVRYIQLGSYYYLPVLLYGFLLYLMYDLVMLVNRAAGFASPARLQSVRLRGIVLSMVLIITGGLVAYGIHNFQNTRLEHYTIEVPQKEGKLNELKVAMAADIHLDEQTRMGFVRQFVEKMNAADADVVLLVGDILESGRETPKFKHFEKAFNRIESKYGVYAVEGNHEHYGHEGEIIFFEHAGIMLLQDTVVKVEESFYLAGRRDRHVQSRASVDALVKQASDSLPVLMMDHQPYELEKTARNKVDVQFSGHTHHGQLWPLNYITESIYRISWGHEKIGNTHFFVTCGAQGWGPPVKTSSFSEIMVVRINFKNAPTK
jgi:predicted MPP superfamily phosphohydrolase